MRALYSSADHAHDGDGHNNGTQALRIAAIFVILAAGLLGGIPPVFFKAFRDQTSLSSILARAFSSGVILALACVHVIPEAILQLSSISEAPDKHAGEADAKTHLAVAHRRLLGAGHGDNFPYGGVCILGGIVIMIFFEHVAHAFYGGGGHSHEAHAGKVVDSSTRLVHPEPSKSQRDTHLEAALDSVTADHAHECVSRGPATNWAGAYEPTRADCIRSQILVVLFEFGCIFHSLIIGLALGVNETNYGEARALLIALAFHQWLEGICLASVVSLADLTLLKRLSMVVVYSMTCPVGIAIGIGIAETYDGESELARGVQGSFNGVSGGMLLYISLVQLIAEDMSRAFQGYSGQKVRMLSYACLVLGGAFMCMLAIWT